ncbi:2-C-methyl-D-erythritol 2,4-cyclodiphosphate synthase [Cloacibacillus sp.]
MDAPRWSFLIAAGGSGKRLGGEPKQFRELLGKPLWRWSWAAAEGLRRRGEIEDIVLVVPREYEAEIRRETEDIELTVTCGGATRSESVVKGLMKCSGSHVLVHDGARPFITPDLCRRLMAAAEGCGTIPLLPSVDSLKKIEDEKISCADRSLYFRTQTPQAFERARLIRVIEEGGLEGTDEAAAWLAAGERLAYVMGEEKNFKVTTPFDWEMACALTERAIEKRTGHGYDIHQLVEGRPLVIAGIRLEGEKFGLLGHSDADLVTHTVMDALLGAAGEPDIGTLFPASDERWRGADSVTLLHSVLALLSSKGWRVEWVDVTLNAQRPRMGHLVPRFIEKMNGELGGGEEKRLFNMKIKSAENCGSAGRGECMICHGVATISRLLPFEAAVKIDR